MEHRRSAIRTAVVWDALHPMLQAQHAAVDEARPLRVIDLGGGTGEFAVRIAELGHQVVVVDPSPDALASLERRTAELGVTEAVRGVLGDADRLLDVVEPASADVVLCHGLLEVVDTPARALGEATAAMVEGGSLSVVAAQQSAAVFSRALAGHLSEALGLLDDLDDGAGRADGGDSANGGGSADRTGRRFTLGALRLLLADAGLTVTEVRGVRVFADHLSSALVDSEPGAGDELRALEAAVATRPEFMAIATQLHLLAVKRR